MRSTGEWDISVYSVAERYAALSFGTPRRFQPRQGRRPPPRLRESPRRRRLLSAGGNRETPPPAQWLDRKGRIPELDRGEWRQFPQPASGRNTLPRDRGPG